MKDKILINLSRIGKKGTGLYVFSKDVVRCLSSYTDNISIVASKSVDIGCNKSVTWVPDWISMTQDISRIRPILWLLYATFFFPGKKYRILSTTHHVVPRVKKQIVTIHDLRPYFFPDTILQRFYFRYLLPRKTKRVDGILTVSEATKKLIIVKCNVPSEKIYVVPNCVDVSKFFPRLASASSKELYLLMVGATWPHKNAHELIENHEIWSGKYRLKIIAGDGRYREKLIHLVMRLKLMDKVDFIGYISESELVSLYQNAAALVYPSLMEGFGIPPLEAMACGIPVIASDIEVFREMYSAVPIYVELGERTSWENAFKLLDNKEFIANKIQVGFQISKEFTMEKMCSALVSAILNIWPDLE